MTDHRVYGRSLRAAMSKRQVSIRGLAETTGLSPRSVNYYTSGERLPMVEAAARIADALEAPELYRMVHNRRTRSCRACGGQIIDNGRANVRQFCGPACAKRKRPVREQVSAERLSIMRKCQQCEPQGRCYDGGCALRTWSPFALVEDVITPIAKPMRERAA